MKNTLILFSIILLLIACNTPYSIFEWQKVLKDKGDAKIELVIESKNYSTSKSSGTADGELLFQRLGNLKEVVESFNPEKVVVIESIPDRYHFNLKVTNYPSAQISDLSEDILNFMAEKADFKWKIENRKQSFYSLAVSDSYLLHQAKNVHPEIDQLSSTHPKRVRFIGSLDNFILFLEKIVDTPIRGDVPKLDFKLDIELPNGDMEALLLALKNTYGLSLTPETGLNEAIVITSN